MDNKQSLISAAMLETMWDTRKKDMIDLITPFIMYAVAKHTSPGEVIDIKKVLRYIQENNAYPDLPEAIVKAVLNRKPYDAVKKVEKRFCLVKSIDYLVQSMDSRRQECDHTISIVIDSLKCYLAEHCTKIRDITEEKTFMYLHSFFSKYGLDIEKEELASVQITPEEYEADYYIAQFIFECKDSDNTLYKQLIDLLEGYFLRLAMYIQPENGNIQDASFSKTTFILDTSILLDVLGYQGKERQETTASLMQILLKHKAKLRYFPHITQEVIDILTAYKYSLCDTQKSTTRTLEGLDEKGYNVSDVEREISFFQDTLKKRYQITEQDIPAYKTKADNSVDEQLVLSETELKEYIQSHTPHYSEENLQNDITTVLAVHKLREGHTTRDIELSSAVFITNNIDFIQAFNRFYRDNFDKRTFQLALSTNALSAITWIKCGEIARLSETELLRNAYSAMQPIPEMRTKFSEVLSKLEDDGELEVHQVIALRASKVFQNALWVNSFGDLNAINETSVKEAKAKYEDELLASMEEKHRNDLQHLTEQKNHEVAGLQSTIASERENHENALQEREKDYQRIMLLRDAEDRKKEAKQNEKFRKAAGDYAKEEREKWLRPRIKGYNFAIWIVFFITIAGLIASLSFSAPFYVLILLAFFLLVSGISVYDTIMSKKGLLHKWLNKRANQVETKKREEKMQEYRMFISD